MSAYGTSDKPCLVTFARIKAVSIVPVFKRGHQRSLKHTLIIQLGKMAINNNFKKFNQQIRNLNLSNLHMYLIIYIAPNCKHQCIASRVLINVLWVRMKHLCLSDTVVLEGETQEKERVLTHFSHQFVHTNPRFGLSEGTNV